mgnify:FL=1
MSVSFWKARSTIPIEQTSQSVPVLNGLSFSGGQELRIQVPPTTKFIQPKECYLQADFKIKMDTASPPTKLQLDARLGGQVLIKDIRIFSSAATGSVLLEEIQGYNSMVSVMRDYDTNDSEKKKRAMTEGATIWVPQCRGTEGSTRSECADTPTNPYFKDITEGNKTVVFDETDFTTAKLCLPLETGIFRSDKVWVNMLTGLEIVITLEDAGKCVRQLDSVLRNRRLALNPRFHSTDGSVGAPALWNIASGPVSKFYIFKEYNSNMSPALCPFVVGERINFCSLTNASLTAFTVGGVAASPRILEINDISASGVLEIVLTAAATMTSADDMVSAQMAVYSQSVETSPAYAANYELSNVELVVQEVDMGKSYVADLMAGMKERGVIVHDILSATNYRYSQAANDVVANIRLPLSQARAKSIVCVPTDATVYSQSSSISCSGTYDVGPGVGEDVTLFASDQLRGISDRLTDYQFLYGGRLQPSRPVRCSKTSSKVSIDAQPLIETSKALVQANINARSLACFNSNFVIARAFALNYGVYDTRNTDFNLQVNYQGLAPDKPKLWNNYVFGLRRINIRGDNISVEV